MASTVAGTPPAAPGQPMTSFASRSTTTPHDHNGFHALQSFNNNTNINPSMSFSPQHPQQPPQHQPVYVGSHASHNGPNAYAGYRSFNDGSFNSNTRTTFEKPQIYTAVYSGVSVYEMEISGVACMRRRADSWLNATQILKVAGVDKGKRTKVLEKEILTGDHEKVQGGYGKYQGTWINYERGREFCRQYGVEDILRPLLEYDRSGDGPGAGQSQETPTKEQAMAANRKKFYNSSMDNRNGSQAMHGTFFQNISSTTHVALAAMNKAARINSPAPPRPSSAQRQPSNFGRRPSQQQASGSQQFPSGSQQSMHSEPSFTADRQHDSVLSTHLNGTSGYRQDTMVQEPPNKRMRPSSHEEVGVPYGLPVDTSLRSLTPTEPNESFLYDPASQYSQYMEETGDEPVAMAPLPEPSSTQDLEKRAFLLDLFADSGRTDFASHPAFQLSPSDFDTPLDASANTALHWASTLGRVSLLKLLVARGANIWRGNAAGQTPLISAVLVNNCWEHSSFPDLLELLNPLIEVRDAQGRTILHHIAVSCGIKGRAPSSKYYLEVLLEFLVRSASHANPAAVGLKQSQAFQGQSGANGVTGSEDQAPVTTLRTGPISLMRFLTHIVNARDRAGNTALNLAARIGNRSIIQQLLEIKADPSLANYKGVSARDFGVGVDDGEMHIQRTENQLGSPEKGPPQVATVDVGSGSQSEEMSREVVSSMTSLLTQNLSQHQSLVHQKSAQIDKLNAQIRELSAIQKRELEDFCALQRQAKSRTEREQKIANLKREVAERRARHVMSCPAQGRIPILAVGAADAPLRMSPHVSRHEDTPLHDHVTSPGSPIKYRAHLAAYRTNNTTLSTLSKTLQSRSGDLEAQYRKVVSLCTGVPEERVEGCLTGLVAAVESERGGGLEEVGRVREFLRLVEGS
ncbi:transcriptional regulator swi6 [Elasticomyces elasticus]|nr:transcriptional regulator swi6 [Elasticomyces elasticus]